MDKRDWWKFFGLVIAWPALAYLAIFQTWEVDACSNTHSTATMLVISGLAAWIVMKRWR